MIKKKKDKKKEMSIISDSFVKEIKIDEEESKLILESYKENNKKESLLNERSI